MQNEYLLSSRVFREIMQSSFITSNTVVKKNQKSIILKVFRDSSLKTLEFSRQNDCENKSSIAQFLARKFKNAIFPMFEFSRQKYQKL